VKNIASCCTVELAVVVVVQKSFARFISLTFGSGQKVAPDDENQAFLSK
jgi:hypothetical protein